ncbi:MAG TPA: type II toxin-antitoxin system PemK/MazF family toxin [Desulfosporosinus sp.]|nr:type II toxin-antitoxin system PemK/MazF family toxin [Desulfosporosinus sp.]
MHILVGDVWFAEFPLEEDSTHFLRPVIVLNVDTLDVLSVKVTKTNPRAEDNYDTPIIFWQTANLRCKSTARVTKTIAIDKSQFKRRIGTLHPDDLIIIQNLFIHFIQSKS